MFCKSCGKEISNETGFCAECGSDASNVSVKKEAFEPYVNWRKTKYNLPCAIGYQEACEALKARHIEHVKGIYFDANKGIVIKGRFFNYKVIIEDKNVKIKVNATMLYCIICSIVITAIIFSVTGTTAKEQKNALNNIYLALTKEN